MRSDSIHKILIANRGDIALRIQRAAFALHIPVAAVYSEKEAGSYWLSRFQDSLSLGDGKLADTYLNIPLIISRAIKAGADAIHPGYGFLSENPLFAQACEENGLQFIGPSASILKLMGDKLAAHEFVASLGIPVIEKIIDTPDEIGKRKHTLEYPVLVKAAAGGGGKGMRVVRSHSELTDVLEITASEAFHYFADERVFVEKYLHAPRHIEVQIMADNHGNVVHFFERECSIQRRHQKIIEESRAIAIPAKAQNTIIDAAVTIARAVHYVNAGTIEFLLDDSGDFFFLEMNPRIQVEHGITELITGIDLVKEQIRIAEGNPLSFSQADINSHGHAIEARIYAEDPENDLMPSPGRLHYFKDTAVRNVRTDSSVTSGSMISPDFDPLIARILAYGQTREEAISGMRQAIAETVITGVRHNISLLSAIMNDEDYTKNNISTTYLQERFELFRGKIGLLKNEIPVCDLIIAATLISLFYPGKGGGSVWQSLGFWRMVPQIRFQYLDVKYSVEYRITSTGSATIWFSGKDYEAGEIQVTGHDIIFRINESLYHFYFVRQQEGIIVLSKGGLDYEIQRSDRQRLVDRDQFDEENTQQESIIKSPLPGKVSRIYVKESDMVNKGDQLVTIESMKLENGILAPGSGIIEQILVHEGDQVMLHQPLIYVKK